MKKLIWLLIFIAIIITGGLYINKTPIDKELKQKEAQLQSMIDENLKKEQDEKVRKLEIQALQNPDIINSEMKNVKKLIVFEGIKTYTDVIRKTTFFGTKQMDLDLKYKYGISYDLSKIIVDSFVDKTVYIKLNSSELKLEYLDEDNQNSKINNDSTWFASDFESEDTEAARDNAKLQLQKNINDDKNIYIQSMKSLKDSLTELILKLGYDNVVFID